MIRRDALYEYARGSCGAAPLSVVAALAAGALLSAVPVGVHSPLAFQGTADDARTLLIGIASTMVTVIALLLGLTVVALQLSSTQFSPRLLRNFLRDRPNQIVLSVFVATFAYSAAGLYTVGVSAGNRTDEFPAVRGHRRRRAAVRQPGLLVFFADHLAHSIQVDAIMRVGRAQHPHGDRGWAAAAVRLLPSPAPGRWPIPAHRSGYVQAVHRRTLLGRRRPAPGPPPAAAPGRRARRRRHHAGLGLARLAGDRRPTRGHSHGHGDRRQDRLRAHPGTGRRVRHPAARRHGVQGPVAGGERPLHRGPGHRPPVCDLLRARPPAARASRRRHPTGAAVIVPARRFPEYLALMSG